MGSAHWQNYLHSTLNLSPFLKENVRGYRSSSDVIMQFCPFSRLSSIIDWNGFASLTICIAPSFNISHLFTQSLSLHITPALIISMHYLILLISTEAVWFWSLIWRSCSTLTTSLLKIKWANFFPPQRVAYDSCASCSVASLKSEWEKGKCYLHSCAVQGGEFIFFCLFFFTHTIRIVVFLLELIIFLL